MQDRALTFGFGTLVIAALAAGTGRGVRERAETSVRSARPAIESARSSGTSSAAPLLDDSIITGEALLKEFFGDSLSHAVTCRDASSCYELDVLIVSLPDPLDSYLDWAFDADLESMRRAFESAQYVTNRFWLPWTEDRRVVAGRAPTCYRRSHPGVFLFRSSDPARRRLRLVYVVGEISTGGVHKRALEVALDERRSLLGTGLFDITRARDTIRFVGPFFTGSGLSTRLTLEKWRNRTTDSSYALFVSGSASGASNLLVFDTSRNAAQPAHRMSFRGTVNSDLTLTAAMMRVIVEADGLGIPAEHVALVQESSTQYGQQVAPRPPLRDSPEAIVIAAGARSDTSRLVRMIAAGNAAIGDSAVKMLVIPFPMSISSLRAEYARHPASKGAQQLENGDEPRIPLSLDDSNQQLESPIPIAQLTPAALELMLEEITRTLKSHDIRAIGLIGTDVRDKIFLADELRKRLPDARLFTFGSSDLYLREDYNNSLRGMLVFSTYPLFLENQWWDWVNYSRPRRLAFPSDDAEGVFNATLRQLGRRRLREYQPPFDSIATHPPVWVSAVGRHSFVPIRTLTSLPLADEYFEQLPALPTDSSRRAVEHHISGSDWATWLAFIAAAAVILLLVLRADAASRERVPVHERGSQPVGTSGTADPVTTSEGSTDEIAIHRFVDRRRRGLRAALLLHREVYTFLRHLALLCSFGVLAVILVPQGSEAESLSWASPTVFTLLPLMALAAVIVFGDRIREVWREWGGAYRDYVYRPPHKWIERELARVRRLLGRIERHQLLKSLSMLTPTLEYEIRALAPREERSVWRREGIVIAITAVVGVLYAAAVARLIVDLKLLGPSDSTVFLHRAMQLDSGVSPIFPIVLSGAALAVLCTWQLSRITLLDEVTAFEEAFQLSTTKASHADADETKSRIAKGLRDARIHLSRVVPDLPSGVARLGGALLLVVVASGLWVHFEPSFEAITGLRRTGGFTAFDIVFRLSIIMIFGAAAWGLARLIMVWRALCVTLRALDASPLITAFERLPRRIARLTRLTLFADPSQDTVLAVTATQWTHLRGLFEGNKHAFEELSAETANEIHELMLEDAPLNGRAHRRCGTTFAPQLKQMLGLIERFWALEPAEPQIQSVLADLKDQRAIDGASTCGRIRRSFPDVARLWVRSAEEFVAVQAVDYIAWVLRHLRRLVVMLLFLLVLTMALLSSYSFLPQSVVRTLFLGLFIAIVIALLFVLAQMNRDEVLSRVTRTDPGRLTWNSSFVLNIGMVVAIPILSLVSAFSPMRTDLFGWVDGLLRLLSKH